MKNYKNFFIKTLIIFLSAMIIIPTSLIYWVDYMIGRHNYSKTANYINYLIEQKRQKAFEFDKQGNKIVFFSGSNTLYGINTKYIHEKTNLPVVNFGIHMGLEYYIFHEVMKILKPGDTVIMPIEYSIYKKDSTTIPFQLAEYIVCYGKDYFNNFTIVQKLGLSFYLIKLLVQNRKLDVGPVDDKILNQTNEFGDFVENIGTVKNLAAKNAYLTITENIPDSYEKFALYHFIQFCKKNNIKLYAMLPFISHKNEYSEKEVNAYNKIKSFYIENGVDFIGDMKSGSATDLKYVHDYCYHANQEGQKIRSDYMINVLSDLNYL